jgi:putative transposase
VARFVEAPNHDCFRIAQQSLSLAELRMPWESNTHPSRPPRLELIFSNTRPFYFVTFNTYQRLPLLARPEIHAVFQLFCCRAQEHAVTVGRYVLMPDHAHLFIVFPGEGITLAQWVQGLRSVIGKKLSALGFQKPHWQEGFFDHLLRSRESDSQKWDYVRMNPVRAGLSRTPEEWPYQGEIIRLGFD